MFPPLPYASWSDTLLNLHLVTQIVGKVRLALHPPINHWWHATLYVSPRGLTTGAIPLPASREQNSSFDVEIDLLDHRVVTRTSDGRTLFAALADRPVCDFYREFTGQLQQLGELKAINAMNDAQRRMQQINDEYDIDGAVSVFDKTAGSIQEQADKLQAMDTLAVSEGEELDRQLAAISKKTEVDDALEALKARLGEGASTTRTATPAAEKQKVSSAFEEQK